MPPEGRPLPVPQDYGGILWLPAHSAFFPFAEFQWMYFSEVGLTFLPHSPPSRAYNDAFAAERILRFADGPHVFAGAWFSGNELSTVQIRFYRSSDLVHSSAVQALSPESAFLSSEYDGPVDAIGIYGSSYFALDDLEFDAVEMPVPEPSGAALILTGSLIGTWYLSTFQSRRR
jgi:hypothetical protein